MDSVDEDAEDDLDSDESVLDVGEAMEDDAIIIRPREPRAPRLRRADGEDLDPIRDERDLQFSESTTSPPHTKLCRISGSSCWTARLPLDPLPADWAAHGIKNHDFAFEHEPLASDTDDESDYPGSDYIDSDDDHNVARREPRREPRPAHGHDQGRNGGLLGEADIEKVEQAMRKRRKQMDEINFLRLCITLAVRYRNGAHESHDALEFLDQQQHFVTAWQWMNDKLRYAAGCLERPEWRNFRGNYKG